MKAKWLKPACRCGAPYTMVAPSGKPYWCLFCDAHAVECPARGTADRKACGCHR